MGTHTLGVAQDGMLVSSLNQEEIEPLFWSKSLENLVKFQIRHNDIDVREIQIPYPRRWFHFAGTQEQILFLKLIELS